MARGKKLVVGNLLPVLTLGGMLLAAPVTEQDEEYRIRALARERGAPAETPPPEAEPSWTAPAAGRLSSEFGSRWGAMHLGVDITNAIGTPVLAAADGTVIDSGPASGYGLWVRVRHEGDVVTVYGHVQESSVHVGQNVRRGQRIAAMGDRGRSTGPHLHFQLEVSGKAVDPVVFYAERGLFAVG